MIDDCPEIYSLELDNWYHHCFPRSALHDDALWAFAALPLRSVSVAHLWGGKWRAFTSPPAAEPTSSVAKPHNDSICDAIIRNPRICPGAESSCGIEMQREIVFPRRVIDKSQFGIDDSTIIGKPHLALPEVYRSRQHCRVPCWLYIIAFCSAESRLLFPRHGAGNHSRACAEIENL